MSHPTTVHQIHDAGYPSRPLPPSGFRSSGAYLKDAYNRTVILHGLNLSGASKMPYSKHSGKVVYTNSPPEILYDHRSVSFVGRPFPLEEADQHFRRMREWGVRLLRVPVTWEALEHEGPGIYDEDYISYLIELLVKAGEHGLKCFIDPHQDCWSRFTGGSGAPGWTLEFAGFDMTKFTSTGAAVLQNTYPGDKHKYPFMVWSTNSSKLGALTLSTLFFGGVLFAPHALVPTDPIVNEYLSLIEDLSNSGVPNLHHLSGRPQFVNIQHHLRAHFLFAFRHLARRIYKAPNLQRVVMGFDSLNEPSPGYLGRPDLSKLEDLEDLRIGDSPTPFEGMQLGAGEEVNVEEWGAGIFGPLKIGMKKINAGGDVAWKRKIWRLDVHGKAVEERESRECLWAACGVWSPTVTEQGGTVVKKAELLKPDYFAYVPNTTPKKPVDWLADFWKPYVDTFAAIIRSVDPKLTIFVEPPINEKPPAWTLSSAIKQSFLDVAAIFGAFGIKPLSSFRTQNAFDLTTSMANLSGEIPGPPGTDVSTNIVVAPHFYDGQTNLYRKIHFYTFDFLGYKRHKYLTALGAISFSPAKSWLSQVRLIADEIHSQIGPFPIIFGETGMPMDMSNKRAYHDGNYGEQIKGMTWILDAMDGAGVGYCLWNYCPDNSNSWGDGPWNGEDFSIWCNPANEFEHNHATTCCSGTFARLWKKKDTPGTIALKSERAKDIYVGGRALEAVIRPYPLRVAGKPISWEFKIASGFKKETSFTLTFEEERDHVTQAEHAPTEIFVPKYHFPPGVFSVQTTPGRWEYDEHEQLVKFWAQDDAGGRKDNKDATHKIKIWITL